MTPNIVNAKIYTFLVGNHIGRRPAIFIVAQHRTAFTRQSANLWNIKIQLQKDMAQRISPDNDLFLFDGIPSARSTSLTDAPIA